MPVAALAELVRSAAPETVATLGRAIGFGIGARAAAGLTDSKSASLEDFVTQLAGEAAMAGIGAWSLERWGRALVVVLRDAPAIETLLAPLVAAALEAASGRKVSCTLLSNGADGARVLVSSDRAVQRVRQWTASGVSWGDAIAKLHGERS